MEWANADHALPHVHQSLRDSDHEEAVGLLVVVTCQLPEHLTESSVVGARANETHGKDSVQSNLKIAVVGVF